MTAASVWSLLLPAIDQATEEGKVPGWLPAAAGMLRNVKPVPRAAQPRDRSIHINALFLIRAAHGSRTARMPV